MSEIALELYEIHRVLDGLLDFVQKSRTGMSKEDAKRIFHRYRSKEKADETSTTPPNPPESPTPGDRQAGQMTQILNYMEQTTQRLDQIETDIGSIKEKVDSILKRL